MNSKTWVAAALGMAAGLAGAAGEAGAQAFMRPSPIFWPDGREPYPFHVLPAGLWATPTGGLLTMGAGVYHDTGVFNKRLTITASNGPAVIGPAVQRRVPLKVACYNTHLFGQDFIVGLPRWLDGARSFHIGQLPVTEDADLFLMQEAWDPELVTAMRALAAPVTPRSFYGGLRDGLNPLNSGLLTFSKTELTDNVQFFYTEEHGTFESLSSKGFIRSTMVKGGIPITVYNTHTQSGSSQDDIDTRLTQLQELAVSIQVFRVLNPTHVVIVAGDFNVVGLSGEYINNLQSTMGALAGMAEGAKNIPILGNSDNCTSCADNELNVYFNPETSNTRLDYVMYAGALDGSVVVVPKSYMRRDYEVPAPFPELCDDGLCTRDLSDHYGIVMEFELVRP